MFVGREGGGVRAVPTANGTNKKKHPLSRTYGAPPSLFRGGAKSLTTRSHTDVVWDFSPNEHGGRGGVSQGGTGLCRLSANPITALYI